MKPSGVELGLDSRAVKLVDHDPKWAEQFGDEKRVLSEALGNKLVDVEHIGSTAIPRILAKPIIDVLAAVKTLPEVESFTQDLHKMGYEDKGTGDVAGRRYFVKGSTAKRTHHLNFCEMNSLFWRSHLAFRDYLRQHLDVARQYSNPKQELARKFPNDRSAYTAGKEEFVRSVVDRAMNVGWNVENFCFPI